MEVAIDCYVDEGLIFIGYPCIAISIQVENQRTGLFSVAKYKNYIICGSLVFFFFFFFFFFKKKIYIFFVSGSLVGLKGGQITLFSLSLFFFLAILIWQTFCVEASGNRERAAFRPSHLSL
jgi:hypothetical protein